MLQYDSLGALLHDDHAMLMILLGVAVLFFGLLLWRMDDDGGEAKEKAKAKQKAEEARRKAEERATYDLAAKRSAGAHGGRALDDKHIAQSRRLALWVLGAVMLLLFLWIERVPLQKLEHAAEREVSLVRELLTMRAFAPLWRGIDSHPFALPAAIFGGGGLVLLLTWLRMPNDEQYAKAIRYEDSKRMLSD